MTPIVEQCRERVQKLTQNKALYLFSLEAIPARKVCIVPNRRAFMNIGIPFIDSVLDSKLNYEKTYKYMPYEAVKTELAPVSFSIAVILFRGKFIYRLSISQHLNGATADDPIFEHYGQYAEFADIIDKYLPYGRSLMLTPAKVRIEKDLIFFINRLSEEPSSVPRSATSQAPNLYSIVTYKPGSNIANLRIVESDTMFRATTYDRAKNLKATSIRFEKISKYINTKLCNRLRPSDSIIKTFTPRDETGATTSIAFGITPEFIFEAIADETLYTLSGGPIERDHPYKDIVIDFIRHMENEINTREFPIMDLYTLIYNTNVGPSGINTYVEDQLKSPIYKSFYEVGK